MTPNNDMPGELNLIQNRRKQIEQEIRDLQRHIVALEDERRELEVAERVVRRLSNRPTEIAQWAGRSHFVSFHHGRDEKEQESNDAPTSTGKPKGTPTVPDMIRQALEYAEIVENVEGWEPKSIADYIARKWWPNVDSNRISPIAWRMWKRGELIKNDSVYSLPKDEAPNGKPKGALKVTGEVGASPNESLEEF